MAGTGARGLNEAMKALSISASATRTSLRTSTFTQRASLPSYIRSLATEAPSQSAVPTWHPTSTVPLTIHSFPSLEPLYVESHPTKHLHLPLRRDLLHLAIIHEASKARQGTASSKTRYEVHGSHRKIRPQKGTGRARQGSKQSPLIRGGGKTFGPHPRDFSTKLTRKVYDKAWRTALSYRYRRGELVVCQDGMELALAEDFWALVDEGYIKGDLRTSYLRKQAKQLMEAHGWGRPFGRTLFVTSTPRTALFEAITASGEDGRALEVSDVDVKDILTEGRVVVEREALKRMIAEHQSDLVTHVAVGGLVGVDGGLLTHAAS
ncbi:related to ribosomal protein YML6, mitochondrial [Cephalotrichum gorgonifer]|uniref:Large ribosomal subunit protein uL4m n=1 Tax=Cephalotrichum gorgonifer TaxID=2041049 RepID=A0AAE8N7Y9_9PEZI|nr:related to ribosomal protein YML6, mitochondrial [Cephalotrichum gorgonifer]